MLSVDRFSLEYLYGAKAVDNVSLEIGSGEHVALLGSGEAGKTSLLKGIAGLYPASGGSVTIDGKDVTNASIKERDLQFVYDDGGLFKYRTVHYNLTYPLRIRKVPGNDARREAYDAADKFGLGAFEEEYVYRLYETEKVKLALARTSLRNASVVLIDDIFGMLPSCRRECVFLEMLPHITGIESSVLFATDSVKEAFSVGERVAFLRYGKIEQFASPDELLTDPATAGVDKYVNSARNFAEVPVVKTETGFKFNFGGYEMVAECDRLTADFVIVSYELKEDCTGERFESRARFFDGNGYIHFNASGVKLRLSDTGSGFTVRPRVEDLRVFSPTDEKRLTFRIL